MPRTVVYEARKILTGDARRPAATHVAVAGGRVAAVGGPELEAGGRPDRRFRDCVLLPGLVESHAHAQEGGYWAFPYVGPQPRRGPDGRVHGPCVTAEEVLATLRRAERELAETDATLFAWGADPASFPGGAGLSAAELDRVSAIRPVAVMNGACPSLHLNHVALRVLDAEAGLPGELREPPPAGVPGEIRGLDLVIAALIELVPEALEFGGSTADLRRFAAVAAHAGVTTVADLGAAHPWDPPRFEEWRAATAAAEFPVRLALLPGARIAPDADPDKAAALARRTWGGGHDKLFLGPAKLYADGALPERTARLREPYLNSAEHGRWNLAPADLARWARAFHRAGFDVHCHCNGDAAADAFLDAIEAALADQPRPGARHVIEHAQLLDDGQLRRMREAGVGASFFIAQLFLCGDTLAERVLGEERAARLDPCASARAAGVAFGLHSDAPAAPLDPLLTAWCAVARRTCRGRVLGAQERIPVAEALRAVTLGNAWLLGLEGEIGSLGPGKRADLCALGEDPLAVEPERLKDVLVRGTVLGGEVVWADL